MAHHWNLPALGGAYGTDAEAAGTWQSAAEPALDPYNVALAGAEIVTGIGLANTYTLLYPEQVILDSELYQRARYMMMHMEVNPETLALDVIKSVGPGGHFLAQKHTRQHMRTSMKMGLAHELEGNGKYRDPVQVAREQVNWILKNYQPQPLEFKKQNELGRILAAADRELNK
jgi:trimethylamine--corrinoid protein Co-methyltransferase